MGPPTLVDGDPPAPVLPTPVVSLQWGRRLSSTETHTDRLSQGDADELQWGRRLSSTETSGTPGSWRTTRCSFNGAADSRRRRRPAARRDPSPACRFNGAADSRRRRREAGRVRGQAGKELQWGRRLSSTETRTSTENESMDPRFNGAADSRRRRRSIRPSMATRRSRFNGAADSRRRRRDGAADSRRRRRRITSELGADAAPPSMGPPTLVDGDRARRKVWLRPFGLQWGRRLSSTETRRPPHLPACLVAVLQWGRRLSSTETATRARSSRCRTPSFNGAADSRRRRRVYQRRIVDQKEPFNGAADSRRRRPPASARPRRRRWSFNGAADSRRRRLPGRYSGPPCACGSFNGAADSRRRRHEPVVAPAGSGLAPSMGPPTLVDGDLLMRRQETRRRLHLQWGRRLSSTETERLNQFRQPYYTTFNGAADSRRRRQWQAQAGQVTGAHLQWGRRLSSTETREGRWPGAAQGSSFNGAADSRRRRRPSIFSASGPILCLQWGRRLSSTETGGPAPTPQRANAFNGAADSRRRRPGSQAEGKRASLCLQWGRRLSSTETCRAIKTSELQSSAGDGHRMWSPK